MTFAEHLKYMRGNSTQSAFCRKLGIPLTTYQRYEKGERVPDINVLTQVVKCLGVSADTLLGLDQHRDDQEPTVPRDQLSTRKYLAQKDAIIAHQQETIENLTHVIEALR
ncbi:MAG: helix-turn-helix transcriptional regulator [bacterium]